MIVLQSPGSIVRLTLLVLLAVAIGAAGHVTPGVGAADPAARSPVWGMAGGYEEGDFERLAADGMEIVLIEMRWSRAEPQEGRWDEEYFASVRRLIGKARRAGLRVVLNFGMQNAPGWMLERPGARFVDQAGREYLGSDAVNLVFGLHLRRNARRYTRKVFQELGQRFVAVRVGGLNLGELAFPYDGRGSNSYWAWDSSARASRAGEPFAGYVPCQGSPALAAGFLRWYVAALVRFQNWQVRMVSTFFPGTIAVLYPSHGMRSGDVGRAAATNLCGTSSIETNGESQRGIDHRAAIEGLPRIGCLAAWGTYSDNARHVSELAGLAQAAGLAKFGENSGDSADDEAMRRSVQYARRFGLDLFMWIRNRDDAGNQSSGRFKHALGEQSASTGQAGVTSEHSRRCSL